MREKNIQFSQCLGGTQQLPECYVLLCRPEPPKKSRILFHIWHALISHISTFWLQMRSVMCETESALLLIPCAVTIFASCPPLQKNTTMYHCVTLFSLLCFEASCSNYCLFTRCESFQHNKYRKGVLVCVCLCEMWWVQSLIQIVLRWVYSLTVINTQQLLDKKKHFIVRIFFTTRECSLTLSVIALILAQLTVRWVKAEATWCIV